MNIFIVKAKYLKLEKDYNIFIVKSENSLLTDEELVSTILTLQTGDEHYFSQNISQKIKNNFFDNLKRAYLHCEIFRSLEPTYEQMVFA